MSKGVEFTYVNPQNEDEDLPDHILLVSCISNILFLVTQKSGIVLINTSDLN
jgi:hypothetical protein